MATTIDFSNFGSYWVDKFKCLMTSLEGMRYIVLMGGRGSGKSCAIVLWLVYHSLCSKKRILVIRKVARSNKQSTYDLICKTFEKLGLAKFFARNASGPLIKTFNTSEFVFMGCDDPAKLKSISDIDIVWIEEADELSEEDFRSIDLGLRGKPNQKIFLSFNPVNPYSWLKSMFFDSKKENAFVLKSNYKDNKFLDEHYIKTLEELKEKNPYLWTTCGEGEWGSVEGVVFERWEQAPFPQYPPPVYGLDFGYTDPSSLTKVVLKDNNLYIKEVFYTPGLTAEDICAKLEAFHINKNDTIYGDNARPEMIEAIYQRGWNIKPCRKGKDSVITGINFMKEFNILIDPASENLKNELYSYSWKKNKEGITLDVPEDKHNHAIDSCRYAVYSEWFQENQVSVLSRQMLGV